MATTSSTQNISGLASGIDTSTIIDQLMAIERQPQTRLKTQVSLSAARKSVLSDIDAAVLAVNSDANAPAYAAAVTDAQSGTKYLVFSSRTTGQTASAFTASASSIVEDGARAVDGLDAQYWVDSGPMKTSASNV